MDIRPSSAIAALALAAASWAGNAGAIELGEASVVSQQGQRLKVVVPYGAAPGETVPVLRFSVQSASAPAGAAAPDPALFTIAKPARGNLVVLQSSEVVSAPEVELVLAVAGQPGAQATYRLKIPPAQLAASPVEQAATTTATGAPQRAAAPKRKASAKAGAAAAGPKAKKRARAQAGAC